MAVLLLTVLFGGTQWRFGALALGWFYAALIFSFVGGTWWGLSAAASAGESQVAPPAWLWGASVLPSLIALATLLPWLTGEPWPGPSLVLLGLALAASPLIDRRAAMLGLTPPWWMGLRVLLSGGLGLMAVAMGLAA